MGCAAGVLRSVVRSGVNVLQVDVPRAPGLGLVLEQTHYAQYDVRYGKTHASLEHWDECEVRYWWRIVLILMISFVAGGN
jgi:hypothetical protein